MKIAFQMDPIEDVDINADSTFRLAEEAQNRGHDLYVYTPNDLTFNRGKIIAKVRSISLKRKIGDHVNFGAVELLALSEFDVIWLRQDPPFDMGYITNTHLLDLIGQKTLIVNNPFWVRNLPEKLLVLEFPDLIPETVISRDLEEIKRFKNEFKDIIIKPLYGNGGAGIFRLREDDKNLTSLHELFSNMSSEPLIAQAFLPDVKKGDKRIILVDGEPVGAINRVPKAGETRSNMHVGGKAEPAKLSQRDREICRSIGPILKNRGQVFVGIDVIGDYLTEINVTSPTGIQELERFDKVNIAEMIWHAVEKKVGSLSLF
ncbi:MAG: glutathione synthase [Rhodobacteraceae bacterium]|jgi:glutathione synthase|nr:MAG: glutathione synthase [Paracoccaceae bacterium]|tara:strand:- start:123 stop:1073 length:951 start_codon:yes stop_codon:yes gene_type:complete